MRRFQEKEQERERLRKDNKGFSLVELIIVIAIMAILVGIVGTQVIPYLNRSREAKDLQIINSFSTAAVSAYSQNAELFSGDGPFEIHLKDTASLTDTDGSPLKTWAADTWELAGYTTLAEVKKAMSSSKGKNDMDDIVITLDLSPNAKTLTVQAKTGTDDFLDPVVSHI